jgi:hypothetical protein
MSHLVDVLDTYGTQNLVIPPSLPYQNLPGYSQPTYQLDLVVNLTIGDILTPLELIQFEFPKVRLKYCNLSEF